MGELTLTEKPPGYVTGRPTDYIPEYCEMLIEHMKQGRSFVSFGAVVRASAETLYEWKRKHKAFSESAEIGRTFAIMHFEKISEEGMMTGPNDKKLNAGVWKFMLTNLSGGFYKDTQETHVTGAINHEHTHKLEPAHRKARIAELLAKKENELSHGVIDAEECDPTGQ